MKFNKLNSVRHVAGTNFAQMSCCASEKEPTHTRGCVAATCPCNFLTSVQTLRIGPCYVTLLHSPATCPLSVYLTRFCPRYILQQHVPATCPLLWAHLNEECCIFRSLIVPKKHSLPGDITRLHVSHCDL